MSNLSDLGKFPVEGELGRAEKEFYKITPDDTLKTVFGTKYPVPVNFFVSNDVVSFAEINVPSGGIGARITEVMCSEGDTIIYIIEGPITVFLPDLDQTYLVHNNEVMFIPEKVPYQIINYEDIVARAIIIAAPMI